MRGGNGESGMARLIDATRFSDLVGAIYDCAVDPAGWPETLRQLNDELEFANSSLAMTSLPEGRTLINETHGIPDVWKQRMGEFARDIVEMWGGPEMMLAYPFDRATVLSRVNPGVMQSSNRYVREWGEPQGLIDSAVTILAHDSEGIGNWALGRHRDQGAIRDIDVGRINLFIPHLQRAVKISRLFEAQSVAARRFETVIDELATPVVLVDCELKILHANRSAEELFAEGTILASHNGRLLVDGAGARKAIRDIVAQVGENETGLRSGAIGLPPVGTPVAVHSLHVLPLRSGSVRQDVGQGAAAAIFVSSPKVAPGRVSEVMTVLFGFTGAETRVFEHLVAGQTSRQVASSLGIAPSTVRTHLLRIFGKTGVHRQSSLIQLAAALAPPVREEASPG